MRRKYLYLPEVNIEDVDYRPENQSSVKGVFPCPCCGYLTLPVPREEAVAYICPVCYWENDVFTKSDDEPSDENHGMTLNEGRKNYKELGACSERLAAYVRKPIPEEIPE